MKRVTYRGWVAEHEVSPAFRHRIEVMGREEMIDQLIEMHELSGAYYKLVEGLWDAVQGRGEMRQRAERCDESLVAALESRDMWKQRCVVADRLLREAHADTHPEDVPMEVLSWLNPDALESERNA